jgi:hypothetical protein
VTRLTVVPLRSSPSQGNDKNLGRPPLQFWNPNADKSKQFLGACLLTFAHYGWGTNKHAVNSFAILRVEVEASRKAVQYWPLPQFGPEPSNFVATSKIGRKGTE